MSWLASHLSYPTLPLIGMYARRQQDLGGDGRKGGRKKGWGWKGREEEGVVMEEREGGKRGGDGRGGRKKGW